MYKALETVGHVITIGLSFAGTTVAGVRVGWGMDPRPMPHQLSNTLDHPWRLAYRNPGETLGLYGFEAGITVLDAGCGTGLFSQEMARMVGAEGTVHAVDLQLPCIEHAAKRVAEAELSERIHFHHCGLYAVPLPAESIDLAIMIATLGEIPEPTLAMAELWRLLKPGGRLAISDEVPNPAYLRARQVRRLAERAGFRFGGKDGSPFCYSVMYFKDS